MTPDALVKRIRELDRMMEDARVKLRTLSLARGQAIEELWDQLGGQGAADALGISRTSIYRAMEPARGSR